MPYSGAESPKIRVDVVYNLVVDVRRGTAPVVGANIIVLSKKLRVLGIPPAPTALVPEYYTAKTDSTGKAYFSLAEGSYLVLADDGTDWRAYRDEVKVTGSPTVVVLYLTEKLKVRYYLKLYLSADVAPYIAPVVDALLQLTDMFLSIAAWILAPLGITTPATELARHFNVEKVEGVKNELTIWVRYTGSPIPQAVALAIVILAMFIVLFVVAPLVLRWAFGEELPAVIKWIAIAVALSAAATLVGSVASIARRRE